MMSADNLHSGMPAHQRTLSSFSQDDLFSSITGLDDDDLGFDDLDGMDESKDSLGALNDADGTAFKKGGAGKRLASTAEKKATHNAVERARRESLNTRFLVLADMLPGMNHVKRASKAAIVNKSIALIQDLRATEKRLASENGALKAELENVKQKLASTSAAASAATASASAVAASSIMPPIPMPPYHPSMPAFHQSHLMMQQQQQFDNSNSSNDAHRRNSSGSSSLPSASFPMMQQPPPPPHAMAIYPGFPGGAASYFGGMLPPMLPMDPSHMLAPSAPVKAESQGSPNSTASLGLGQSQNQNQGIIPPASTAEYYPGSLFDFSVVGGVGLNGGLVASPTASWTQGASPPGTVASLGGASITGSEKVATSSISSQHSNGLTGGMSSSQSAPSPASSHSIPTPGNTFSPIPLPSSHHFDPTSSSSRSTPPPAASAGPMSISNPALAAFDACADPAFLAAQFAPQDLAKAQAELQAFIAYQQRMAGFAAAHPGNGPARQNSGNEQQFARAGPVGSVTSPPLAPTFNVAAAAAAAAAALQLQQQQQQQQAMSGKNKSPKQSQPSANQGMGINLPQPPQQPQQLGMPPSGMGGMPNMMGGSSMPPSAMTPWHQMVMAHQHQLSTYGGNMHHQF